MKKLCRILLFLVPVLYIFGPLQTFGLAGEIIVDDETGERSWDGSVRPEEVCARLLNDPDSVAVIRLKSKTGLMLCGKIDQHDAEKVRVETTDTERQGNSEFAIFEYITTEGKPIWVALDDEFLKHKPYTEIVVRSSDSGKGKVNPRYFQLKKVLKGDTLWDIAVAHYGEGRGFEYERIFRLNLFRRNSHWIYPDDIFLVPVPPPSETNKNQSADEAHGIVLSIAFQLETVPFIIPEAPPSKARILANFTEVMELIPDVPLGTRWIVDIPVSALQEGQNTFSYTVDGIDGVPTAGGTTQNFQNDEGIRPSCKYRNFSDWSYNNDTFSPDPEDGRVPKVIFQPVKGVRSSTESPLCRYRLEGYVTDYDRYPSSYVRVSQCDDSIVVLAHPNDAGHWQAFLDLPPVAAPSPDLTTCTRAQLFNGEGRPVSYSSTPNDKTQWEQWARELLQGKGRICHSFPSSSTNSQSPDEPSPCARQLGDNIIAVRGQSFDEDASAGPSQEILPRVSNTERRAVLWFELPKADLEKLKNMWQQALRASNDNFAPKFEIAPRAGAGLRISSLADSSRTVELRPKELFYQTPFLFEIEVLKNNSTPSIAGDSPSLFLQWLKFVRLIKPKQSGHINHEIYFDIAEPGGTAPVALGNAQGLVKLDIVDQCETDWAFGDVCVTNKTGIVATGVISIVLIVLGSLLWLLRVVIGEWAKAHFRAKAADRLDVPNGEISTDCPKNKEGGKATSSAQNSLDGTAAKDRQIETP